MQLRAAKYVDRAYTADTPTLKQVEEGYGESTAVNWIKIQVENMNNFCGVSRKMEPGQMEELSRMILAEVPYLKVAETLLFFHRFKAGYYESLFGSVDPQKVLISLRAFLKERASERYEAVTRKHDEEKSKRDAESKEKGIPYSEYLRIKKERNQTAKGHQNERDKDENV